MTKKTNGRLIRNIKICDRIYIVGRGDWGGSPALTTKYDCNIYLIDGGRELALVDNGETFNLFKLRGNIASTGLDIRKIKKLLITHNHFDHVANTWLLKKALGAVVFAGKGSYFPLKVGRYFKNGSTIKVGDLSLKVYSISGHTPDGFCFMTKIDGKKIVFTGDTAIGDQPKNGRGRVGWFNALWGSNMKEYIKSLKFIKALDADIILPGHGLPQLTRKKCRSSMVNCLKRINNFGNFKELESIIPLAFDRKGVEKCFSVGANRQVNLKIKFIKPPIKKK